MSDDAGKNRLGDATSPYLLQHARNPVHWQPWDESALALARKQDKPILLSIGYAACHWCHVMAHESFEDSATAELMNQLYVNIKVDREERPDLDRVYQLAHQILSQRGGGWPLTVFLAPADLTPFFAGTYFPKQPRYGMPAFKEVLEKVAQFYRTQQQQLEQQNKSLQDVFHRLDMESAAPASALDATPLDRTYRALAEHHDPHFGGFGRAPKFPHAAGLEFLLHRSNAATADAETRAGARQMLLTTLTHMAEGGIHDQLGGGFCRYSVDAEWMIPHFEKMLYDNGPLLGLYAQAWRFSGDDALRETATGIADWAMREMQSPEGGYHSSLDADSEGHEGKFYVWDRAEVSELLSKTEYAVFAPRYGLAEPANFEGHWHLRLRKSLPDIAAAVGLPEVEVNRLLATSRAKLMTVRGQRIRPGLDDKVLTAWNGLMLRGMASAGRSLRRPDCIDSAARAAEFLKTHLWKDGRLLASWRAGSARLPGYLDDYAFLLEGLLELLQARWDSSLFEWARQIADALLQHFEDRQRGGFWFTADDQPVPLQRPRTFTDESMPAGNAIAARALITLGHLSADSRYLDAAERTLKAALPGMDQYPDAHAAMLLALEDALQPPTMVILRGREQQLKEWREIVEEQLDPRRILLAIPTETVGLTGLLAQCTPRGDICAYVCSGNTCSLAITQLNKITEAF